MRNKQKDRGKSSSEISLNKKIVAPQKLKILVLAGNDLLNQHLQFLTKCVNLVKLDVSHNYITRLPERETLSNLSKLQVAFLHYNKINSLEGVRPIYGCDRLVYLTYHHNPLEVHIKNEHQMVNSLPNLKLLNNRVIFLQERSNVIFPSRNNFYGDQTLLESWKSKENSEAYYLKVLNLHLSYIDNLWTFNNPIIVIQRAWKRCLRDKNEQHDFPEGMSFKKAESSKKGKRNQRVAIQLNQKGEVLKNCFQQWKKFILGLKNVKQALKKCIVNEEKGKKFRDKSYLGYTLSEYKREVRNMKVKEPLERFMGKIRRKIYQRKMSERLVASIRLKKVLFAGDYSFYSISGIKTNGRLYYNKNQQHLLDNFLHIVGEKLGNKPIKNALCKPTKRYNAIRLVEPETFSNKFNQNQALSMGSLIWPSMKIVICQRKRGISAFKGAIIGTKQLSYIKNRNKVLTKTQLKKSCEVYNRLQKFALNQYENSLWQLQCSEEETMRYLIRLIYYHNCKALKFEVKNTKSQMLALMRNYDQPLMIYVDNVVKRTAAAVLIQKTWRRYVSNKSQPESIYHKINQNRAALHIQKFYRNHRYFHRLRFNKAIHQNLAFLNTCTIMYPISLYLHLDTIDRQRNRNRLFKQLRISRSTQGVGVNQQFNRPIFQKRIRDLYFGGKMIGTENYESEIDLFNLVHYKVEISLVDSQIGTMIQLKYPTQIETNIAASLIALLTYQPRGSQLIWPFTTATIYSWPDQLKQLQSIDFVRPLLGFPKPMNQTPGVLSIKPIETKGAFVYKEQKDIAELKSEGKIKVQFYQKKYHNFPVKHEQVLRYMQLDKNMSKAEQEKQQIKTLMNTYNVKQQESKRRFGSDGAISIRTIDKEKFSLFQEHEKKKKSHQNSSAAFLNKTVTVLQEKKKQVKKFYQQEELRRDAQKDIKEASLSALRQKAKQQKMLNTTLKSLKEAQRTQQLRNKVKKIKDIKQQSQKGNQQQDFVQQNNFVMQQQLKMIMMRAHIKETEQKREEHSQKKSSINNHSQHFTPSLHSRHSEIRKAPIEEEEKIQEIGQQGSVINVRKRVRRTRPQSIGAYVRDPSFVHGVFPEEYYPIENRATKFYFPPVL